MSSTIPLRHPAVALLPLLLIAASVTASEPVSLFLKDGRRLTGSVEQMTDGELIWKGTGGERQEIPLADVERLEFPAKPAETPAESPADESDADAEEADAEEAEESAPGELPLEPIAEEAAEVAGDLTESPPLTMQDELIGSVCGAYGEECEEALKGMTQLTRRLELGARFRDGNSDEDFVNVASKIEHSDDDRMMAMDFGGQYAEANGHPSANRWFGNTTLDLNREGNWILFLTNKNEFDEFQNLDYRGTVASGVGYRFYNEDVRRLVVRLGPGVTHQKFHAPRMLRTTPDLFGQLELRWPLFDRTQIEHKTTVTPNLEDFQVFRMQSNYGIVVRLDDEQRWSLKVGLQHDYNSRPNVNNRPNDYLTGIRLLYELK